MFFNPFEERAKECVPIAPLEETMVCALCIRTVTCDNVVLCETCNRRAYCSKECYMKDQNIQNNVGQGMSHRKFVFIKKVIAFGAL